MTIYIVNNGEMIPMFRSYTYHLSRRAIDRLSSTGIAEPFVALASSVIVPQAQQRKSTSPAPPPPVPPRFRC